MKCKNYTLLCWSESSLHFLNLKSLSHLQRMCSIPVHRINNLQMNILSPFLFASTMFYISLWKGQQHLVLKWRRKMTWFIIIKNSKRFLHHMVVLSVYTLKHVAGNYEWKDNKMVFHCLSKTCMLPTFLSSIILS